MKKILISIIFLLSFLIVYSQVSAVVDITDKDRYLGLVEQGWNISCLTSSPTEDFDTTHVPNNHSVQINLQGECKSAQGCYLVVCQGPNEQYYEDQERLRECANHDNEEELPESNTWSDSETGAHTWGAWCSRVEEQIGNTFESAQGCSSGVPEVDAILPNSDDPNIPKAVVKNMNGNFHFAPGVIDTTITLNNAYDHIPYQFYSFGQAGETAIGKGVEAEGYDRSQQQSQLTMVDFEATGNISKCVTITWDPYGRVFDSQSLEPIPNIMVNLLDENKTPAKQITRNYDVTTSNGVFNIQVEKQGNYYMSLNVPLTHEFTKTPKLNPNYKYIYSDIYYPDTSFFEEVGVPTHHDIPLNPLDIPYRSDVVVYPKSLNQMDIGNSIKFEGRISHPLARVCLVGEVSKKQYACNQADKIGQFQIFINKSAYPQEALIIKTNKVDPNNIKQFISQSVSLEGLLTPIPVLSNKEIPKFEPLIRYIEGYVYNDKGKIESNADVLIKLKADDKIVGRVRSDENGYIKIDSSRLPLFDYYLELNANNKFIKINTSKFINQNKEYLEETNINPMIDRTSEGIEKKYSNNTDNKISDNNINPNVKNFVNKTGASRIKVEIYLLVFIIIVLIAIVMGVFIYIKKNQH